MPFSIDNDAVSAYGLIVAGLGVGALTRNFKRRGLLRPYQLGYAATWITLGTGIMEWTQLGNEDRIRQLLKDEEARGKTAGADASAD